MIKDLQIEVFTIDIVSIDCGDINKIKNNNLLINSS